MFAEHSAILVNDQTSASELVCLLVNDLVVSCFGFRPSGTQERIPGRGLYGLEVDEELAKRVQSQDARTNTPGPIICLEYCTRTVLTPPVTAKLVVQLTNLASNVVGVQLLSKEKDGEEEQIKVLGAFSVQYDELNTTRTNGKIAFVSETDMAKTVHGELAKILGKPDATGSSEGGARPAEPDRSGLPSSEGRRRPDSGGMLIGPRNFPRQPAPAFPSGPEFPRFDPVFPDNPFGYMTPDLEVHPNDITGTLPRHPFGDRPQPFGRRGYGNGCFGRGDYFG